MPNISKPSDINNVWAATGDIVAPSSDYVQDGWEAIIPPREYFNWLDNRQDRFNAHVNQHGVPVWDATTEYQANLSYTKGSDGLIYKALRVNSNVDPVSDTTGAWMLYASRGALLRTTIYTRSGSTQLVSVDGSTPGITGAGTFTPLPYSRVMRVKAQGAGGGGGGSATTDSDTLSASGGGGAGAYGEGYFNPVQRTVIVGAGGAGGAANSSAFAGTGGTSSVTGLISAPGGIGGQSQPSSATRAGVYGGTNNSSQPSGANLLSQRGGGGVYGLQMAGLSPTQVGGKGGASYFGEGAQGPDVTGPGRLGANYGSGGSGAASTINSAGQVGGAGAAGIIIIEEYA